jgi:hypothetical protein
MHEHIEGDAITPTTTKKMARQVLFVVLFTLLGVVIPQARAYAINCPSYYTSPVAFNIPTSAQVVNGNGFETYGKATWTFVNTSTTFTQNTITYLLCQAATASFNASLVADRISLVLSANQTIYSTNTGTITPTPLPSNYACSYGTWTISGAITQPPINAAAQLVVRNSVTNLTVAKYYVNAIELITPTTDIAIPGQATVAPTTGAPTTAAPAITVAPTTGAPTTAPATGGPTTPAPTAAPTAAPTTPAPTAAPTTPAPVTTAPPTTPAPTAAPTTGAPTTAPSPPPSPAFTLTFGATPSASAITGTGYSYSYTAAGTASTGACFNDSSRKGHYVFNRTGDNLALFSVTSTVGPLPVSYSKSMWIQYTSLGSGQCTFGFNGEHYLCGTFKASHQSSGAAAVTNDLIISPAPSASAWTHVVSTYDSVSTTMTLYVNGVAVGTKTTPVHTSTSTSMFIGSFDSSGQYGLLGNIDLPKLYSTALTPSNVMWAYQNE